MPSLESLRQQYLDMSPEERAKKLREVREDRKVSKHSTTARTAKKDTKNNNLANKFKSLSPEEQALLLEQLGSAE